MLDAFSEVVPGPSGSFQAVVDHVSGFSQAVVDHVQGLAQTLIHPTSALVNQTTSDGAQAHVADRVGTMLDLGQDILEQADAGIDLLLERVARRQNIVVSILERLDQKPSSSSSGSNQFARGIGARVAQGI